MSRPADEPPMVPVVPGLRAGTHPASPTVNVIRESRLTRASRILGMLRDIVVITVLAFLIYFGAAILARVDAGGQADDGVTGREVPSCESPTVDQWGTFCPETPGGG